MRRSLDPAEDMFTPIPTAGWEVGVWERRVENERLRRTAPGILAA